MLWRSNYQLEEVNNDATRQINVMRLRLQSEAAEAIRQLEVRNKEKNDEAARLAKVLSPAL